MSEQNQEKFHKVAKIDEIEGVTASKGVEGNDKLSALSKAKFDAALERAEQKVDYDAAIRQQQAAVATQEVSAPKAPSPIDAVRMDRKVGKLDAATPESIIARAEALQSDFAKIKEALAQQPELQLSKTSQSLLNEKLVHIDITLKAALAKIGAEVKIEPSDIATLKENPAVKFVAYLTQSESQLQQITAQIQRLSYTNGTLSPEKLLAVQLKLGFVQQELEFFTNVVNKTLESIKTVMNVQV